MSKKITFTIRIILTVIVVFALWTIIARQYASFVDGLVSSMVWKSGYYVERASSEDTSLLSPLIPFIILMIGTWGIELVYKEKKVNYRLIIWSIAICVMLLLFTIFGQYLAVYLSVSRSMTQTMLNITSFFIATVPLLVPILAWYSLSKEKLTEIRRS